MQPKLVPLVATLCPALPFTLTAISDSILEQLDSFTGEEITSLVIACELRSQLPALLSRPALPHADCSPMHALTAALARFSPASPADGSEVVRRSIFDDAIFKKLADSCVRRASEFSSAQLKTVLSVYRDIAHRHANLSSTLAKLEAELVPLTSPTPQ